MSTDLPPDAIDLGEFISVHANGGEVIAAEGTTVERWRRLPEGVHRIVAIPMPAPEPPSLARLMAEISVTATHEHSPRPSVTWGEMTESGKDLVTASMQAVIDELGLVCRDEVPTVTVTQVMVDEIAALHDLVIADINECRIPAIDTADVVGATLRRVAEHLVTRLRPDQEPDT